MKIELSSFGKVLKDLIPQRPFLQRLRRNGNGSWQLREIIPHSWFKLGISKVASLKSPVFFKISASRFFEGILRGLFYTFIFFVLFGSTAFGVFFAPVLIACFFLSLLDSITFLWKAESLFVSRPFGWYDEVCDLGYERNKIVAQIQSRSIRSILSIVALILFIAFLSPQSASRFASRLSLLVSHPGEFKVAVGGGDDWLEFVSIDSIAHHQVIALEVKNLVQIRIQCGISCDEEKEFSANGMTLVSDFDNQISQNFAFETVPEVGGAFLEAQFAISENSSLSFQTIGLDRIIQFEISGAHPPLASISYSDRVPLDEFPEDRILNLSLKADAKEGLDLIEMVIKSSDNTLARVKVAEILESGVRNFERTFEMDLKPYVLDDENKLDIWLEVRDRNLPNAQIGKSELISITVLSAYSQYQRILSNIKDQREKLIERSAVAEQNKEDQEISQKLERAFLDVSGNTYFDQYDRRDASQVLSLLKKMSSLGGNSEQMYTSSLELRELIQDFLDSHESFDDRARDRDFFPAMRGVSNDFNRLSTAQRNDYQSRILSFLDSRMARWTKRVEKLPKDFLSKFWAPVRDGDVFKNFVRRYFSSTSEEVRKSILQQLTSEYATWIENLERAEDELKSSQKQELKQNADKLLEKLRTLRQRQAELSNFLDQSEKLSQDKVKEEWRVNQMKQQQNIDETQGVNSEIQRITGEASDRLNAAKESMELVLNSVEGGAIPKAESASDLAARYLRDAASQLQKKADRPDGGKKKKRDARNSEYYGNHLERAYLDIQRQYEVDKRYREDILDQYSRERNESDLSETEGELIQQYLKGIVR